MASKGRTSLISQKFSSFIETGLRFVVADDDDLEPNVEILMARGPSPGYLRVSASYTIEDGLITISAPKSER